MGEFKLNVAFEFSTIECFKCGNNFAVSSSLHQTWRNNGEFFYCPSCGQKQHYAKSTVDKLTEELERKNKILINKNQEISFLEKQVAAQKGRLTKLQNRVSKGVCPCCNRSFQNLRKHMDTKHPDYTKD